ncbi:MAG: S4 domain-containing protein YaaA [Bacillaceae bacterium]
MIKQVEISTEYITLGQVLKVADVISSGGMAKWFIQEHDIFVNGELEKRRGRKLVKGDEINIPSVSQIVIK